jgi:hypothetical protein
MFEYRVGRDRRAVKEIRDRRWLYTRLAAEGPKPRQYRNRWIRRRTWYLFAPTLAASFVEQQKVREGPAHIAADTVAQFFVFLPANKAEAKWGDTFKVRS